MVGAKCEHKTCAYKFIDHIVSPKTNAAIAEYFGEAPANKKACQETTDPNHCEIFHAEDEEYFSKVHYWNTPISACLDGRTDVKCTDYAEWTKAWTEIREQLSDSYGRADGIPSEATMGSRKAFVGLLAAPLLVARGRLPRRAGGDLRDGVLHHRPVHQRGRAHVHHRELPGAPHPDLPAHHRPHPAHRRPGHGAVHRDRRAVRVLHGAGGTAAAAALLVAAVLVPLWASYLVKAYAWRTMLQPEGVLDCAVRQHAGLRPGRGRAHADLPVAALHDPAGVCRVRAAPRGAPRGVGGPRRLGG